MKNVINFNSRKDFDLFIQSKKKMFLGDGSQGDCYLGKDGEVYKAFYTEEEFDYQVDNIIMDDEVNIPSFCFPNQLFLVGDEIVGYKSKFITPDYFHKNYMFKPDFISYIDFDRLIDAYYILYKDVIRLTEKGIKIYDLGYNLAFTGQKLVGYDTCDYSYNPKNDNLGCLDSAMKAPFAFFVCDLPDNVKAPNNNLDVENYLREVERLYKSGDTPKKYVKK